MNDFHARMKRMQIVDFENVLRYLYAVNIILSLVMYIVKNNPK